MRFELETLRTWANNRYHCAREAVVFSVSQYYYKPTLCMLKSTTIHNSENDQFLRLNKQICYVDLASLLGCFNGKRLFKPQ